MIKQNKFFFLPVTIVLLFLISGCLISNSNSAGFAKYSSEHFNIYFDESLYSQSDIISIVAKKERLLKRINLFLNTNFDDTIAVTLIKSADGKAPAWANTDQEIVESYIYLLDDSGHEIVHVVTFEELGHSKSDFFSEGLAVAVEFSFEKKNALEYFIEYRNYIDIYYQLDTTWRVEYDNIYDQLIKNSFSGDSYDYRQAGAFIQYLINQYGVELVKDLYILSISYPFGEKLISESKIKLGIDIKTDATNFYIENFG